MIQLKSIRLMLLLRTIHKNTKLIWRNICFCCSVYFSKNYNCYSHSPMGYFKIMLKLHSLMVILKRTFICSYLLDVLISLSKCLEPSYKWFYRWFFWVFIKLLFMFESLVVPFIMLLLYVDMIFTGDDISCIFIVHIM